MAALDYVPGSDGSGGYLRPAGASPLAVHVNPLGAIGLVELAGVRVHGAPAMTGNPPDERVPTYTLTGLGGLDSTPQARVTITDQAEAHGAFLSGSFYSARTITVEGFILTDDVEQLWLASDKLRGAFALPDRGQLRRVDVLQPGWAERRFVMARPTDSGLTLASPGGGSESRKPYRDWQGVLVAPDPRIYSSTLLDAQPRSLGTGAGTSAGMANDGNFPAPIVWVVQGPAESPKLIDDARGRSIEYSGPVPTGSTLIVSQLARAATLNGGNVYRNLTRFDDLSIPPGGLTLRSLTGVTNTGGTWRAEHRHTWV